MSGDVKRRGINMFIKKFSLILKQINLLILKPNSSGCLINMAEI